MDFESDDYEKADYERLRREYESAVDRPETYSYEQRAAIASYAGSGYKWLNRYLRNNEQENLAAEHSKLSVATRSTASWQRMADLLHEAMDQSRTNRDVVVFRGVRKGALPPNLKVGDEITDDGFISTSMDPGEASGFGWDDPGATIFHVSVPRGTNALPGSKDEHELILRPGSTMKVVGFEGPFTKVVLV